MFAELSRLSVQVVSIVTAVQNNVKLLTRIMGSFASKFLLLGGSSSATAFAEDRFRLVTRAISGVCIFAASAFEFVGPVGTNLGPAATLCSRGAILHVAEGLLAELAASVDKLLLMREVIVFVHALTPMRLTILDVEFMASRVLFVGR
jgi:hypothetical protein